MSAPFGLAPTLPAAEPSWVRTADVAVVGSGVAGLTAALGAARTGRRVLLLTKGALAEGSTCLAQGGVAAALAPGDSPRRHLRDTLDAGAGLCDEPAVRTLVERGPEAVRDLARLGASFDRTQGSADPEGYAFTREGGHSTPRIVHAGGDATGSEVQRALQAAARAAPGVEVVEYAFALDLLTGPDGGAAGLTVGQFDRAGNATSTGTVRAPAVVLATGGFGQLYATTSNPGVATGDGLALALRAGAEVADLEFVQFHPTVFYCATAGRRLLISEALRGEGATLVDATGARIMAGAHPLEDLAPRDVVARAIAQRMAAAPGGVGDHVYLDARALGAALPGRFPTIVAGCRAAGIDPVTDPIPVAPAAHYACGGVRADAGGRTSIPGLYAAGEVACTGVHGANRLASNSLLEGLVMGAGLVAELPQGDRRDLGDRGAPGSLARTGGGGTAAALVSPSARAELAAAMSRHVGVLRDEHNLAAAADVLARLAPADSGDARPGRASWEATNLHTVASVLVAAARAREESRGSHVRLDHPHPRPELRQHLVSRLDPDGTVRLEWRPTGMFASSVVPRKTTFRTLEGQQPRQRREVA